MCYGIWSIGHLRILSISWILAVSLFSLTTIALSSSNLSLTQLLSFQIRSLWGIDEALKTSKELISSQSNPFSRHLSHFEDLTNCNFLLEIFSTLYNICSELYFIENLWKNGVSLFIILATFYRDFIGGYSSVSPVHTKHLRTTSYNWLITLVVELMLCLSNHLLNIKSWESALKQVSTIYSHKPKHLLAHQFLSNFSFQGSYTSKSQQKM